MSGDIITAERRYGGSEHGRRFLTLIRDLLDIEGGLSTHKADKGGTTKYGISLRFLVAEGRIDVNRDGFADFDLDMDGDIDGQDVRRLTLDHAIDLYHRCFWSRHGLWRLPAPIDACVFDQAVNGGAKAAVKMLQKALNRLLPEYPRLKVDGDLGAKTLGNVARAQREPDLGLKAVRALYRAEAANRYRQICNADPSQRVFLDGWLRRAGRLGNV